MCKPQSILIYNESNLTLHKRDFYTLSFSISGTGMMVQNEASSTLCSHPLHLLTGLLLYTLMSLSCL